MSEQSLQDRLLILARGKGVIRPRDLDEIGVPREYLRRLCEQGVLERPGRGLYVLADAEPTENVTLAEACRRIPQGVVCLLSALRFHELTTEAPFEVWMAIDRKAWLPRVDYPPLRIVRFSGRALEYGVEEHRIEKVPCRIYSAAKTVADCFKYRNKIGLDVALEALRDCRKQRKATLDELWEAAKVCRMANVMRPYLEALA
jgi:predicted transcriptional regulator of viral defense system